MGGGLLQLSAYGSENEYINGNPQITFFKTVYRRYTNFSIQSIEVPLEGNSQLSYENTLRLKTKIPRNADLMKTVFLQFTLPDIFSSEEDEFFWIKGIGASMINYIDIFIGGNKIERISGKYIWNINNLTTKTDKRFLFNKMIGNESDLSYMNLENDNYIGSDNTKFTCNKEIRKFYKTRPSISGRILTIPIPFWFTKNTGLAVPLISLQYHEISIEIDFKPVKDLYTIKKKDKMYYYYKNNKHYLHENITTWDPSSLNNSSESSNNTTIFQPNPTECKPEPPKPEPPNPNECKPEPPNPNECKPDPPKPEVNECITENNISKLTFNNLDKNSMYNKNFYSNSLMNSTKKSNGKFININGKFVAATKINETKLSNMDSWDFESSTTIDETKLSNMDSWDFKSSTTINDTFSEDFNRTSNSILDIENASSLTNPSISENASSLTNPSIGENASSLTNPSIGENASSLTNPSIGENASSSTDISSTDISSNINTHNHIIFNNSFQQRLNTLENKVYKINDIRQNAFLEGNLGQFWSYVRKKPQSNKEDHISNFIYNSYKDMTWNHNATLIVEYIFLDVDERKIFAKQDHEYLIEQVITMEELDLLPKSQICLELYHPVKEILFTFHRNDNYQRNEWLNSTSLPYNIADKKKNYQYYLQNSWWFDCCKTELFNPINIVINCEKIICDRFQELLFRYGPYGEAGIPSGSLLGFTIENKHTLYTLKEIKQFKNVWLFTEACSIPMIDKYNFNNYVLNPLKTMQIKFNGSVREDKKTFHYYSYIQPYLYHTKATCEPIYTYSFSLEPEKYQPSGSCNFSRLNNIVFDIELQETPINNKDVKLGKNVSRDYEYNGEFYVVNYNILRISNGMAGIVFSN
jgi:hypothetical protein